MNLHIKPYGNKFLLPNRRLYALYDGEDLVCVALYKKAAKRVKRMLEDGLIFLKDAPQHSRETEDMLAEIQNEREDR